MSRQTRGGGAFASAIIIVTGIAGGNPYWILFGTIAIIVIGLADAWWRWGGVGLEYRRRVATLTATAGDTIDCTIEVTNRKLLPMPWVDVADDWPMALLPDRVRYRGRRFGLARTSESALQSGRADPESRPDPDAGDHDVAEQTDREPLSQRLTLAPFERVQRRYRLICRRRGAYTLGPVSIRWRDAFGLTSRDADLDLRDSLVVYPRIVPVTAPDAAARQLLGDQVRPRALLTDPTRLAGVRPFVSGDSVRRVHWGATARTGVLSVRRDDPTAGRSLWIVVDVETAPPDRWWSAGNTDAHETLAIVAASIASWALRHRTAVGISANGRTSGSVGDLWVPSGGNPRQLARVLDALARLRPWPSRPLVDSVGLTAHAWPPDATIALVTAAPSDQKQAVVARAARHMQPIVVIDCETREAPPTQGVSAPNDNINGFSDGRSQSQPMATAKARGFSSRVTRWRLNQPDAPWATRPEVRIS